MAPNLEKHECSLIIHALNTTNNMATAADKLDTTRRLLEYRIKKFDIVYENNVWYTKKKWIEENKFQPSNIEQKIEELRKEFLDLEEIDWKYNVLWLFVTGFPITFISLAHQSGYGTAVGAIISTIIVGRSVYHEIHKSEIENEFIVQKNALPITDQNPTYRKPVDWQPLLKIPIKIIAYFAMAFLGPMIFLSPLVVPMLLIGALIKLNIAMLVMAVIYICIVGIALVIFKPISDFIKY